MIRSIVLASLRFRYIVVAFAVGLTYFGALRFHELPVDVFPEFAPPQVEIQTIALGLSASETETLVTGPLEAALRGTPGIQVMRSKSVPQLSSIIIIFDPSVEELAARQLVAERMAIATRSLPTWAAPPFMRPPLSTTSRVMKIGITSKDRSIMDLSMLTYWKIRERLLGVSGVANVAIWGEQLKMLQVQVDPEKLAKLRLTLDQVQETTSDALDVGLLRYSSGAHIGTGGFIDTPNQRLGVTYTTTAVTPETLAQVPIEIRDGAPLRLGDATTIEYGPPAPIGDAVVNDGPGLMLVIEKFPWGNTLEVTKGVEAAIEDMKPGLQGVEFDTRIFRPANFIETSINNLSHALLLGCFLVVVVVVLFLYEWRTALVCLVAIPLSLLAAGLVLYETGSSVNTMVLAGFVIAVGVVVDDAILDVENIMRRLRQHLREGSKRSTASIILDASMEVRGPIIYATLIIVLAVLPILFMQGLSGAFFRPLILSYVLAMLASMLVAMTVTPALCLILLRGAPLEGRESPLVVWLGRHYARALERVTRSPRYAYVVVAALTTIGIGVLPFLGNELLPSFKERDFLMHWITNPGTSHAEVVRMTTRASKELRALPGVAHFGSHIGQAFAAEEVVGVNAAENWISIDPEADYDETTAAVQEVVNGYPGLYRDMQTYMKERTEEVLTGAPEAIIVRIFGPDLDVLRDKAENVRKAMSNIDGVTDLHKELLVEVPEVQVKLKLEASRRYGLKPGDARRASAVLMAGEEVGDIFVDGRTYDVQVWTKSNMRHDLWALQHMLIDTPTGERVELGQVADIVVAPTPNAVTHEDGNRRIDVEANVEGRDLSSVAQDVEEAVAQIGFPLGYHATMLGEYAELQSAQRQLLVFAAAAGLGVFLLLQLSFMSWRLAVLSFLTLPSALVGGILAAYAVEGVISLGSLVGFFTVLGLAARNGIMMINHFQHLELYENETFGLRLVLRGAGERLRPILMTAGAAGLAIVPLVISGDLPGYEIEYPMAIVILGGLVTSTLLNLFILPALYLRFGAGTANNPERLAQSAFPNRAPVGP